MQIGKIRGIKIELNISTLLIVALVGYAAASFYWILAGAVAVWELVLIGIISGGFLVFSILLHEIMHSLVAQKEGLKIEEIELHVFGGVSKIQSEPQTPWSEVKIAAAGPLMSLLIGAILLGFFFLPLYQPLWAATILLYLGLTNIILGFFNLIPAFPMDGGRIFRAYLWHRRQDLLSATKTATRVGEYIGFGIIGLGLVQFLYGALVSGFWFIFIGWFLVQTTKQAYFQTYQQIQLSKFKAGELTASNKLVIAADATVDEAVRSYFYEYQKMYFPVAEKGMLAGVVTINDVLAITPEERGSVRVGEIMHPLSNYPVVENEQPGSELLQKLSMQNQFPQILVVKEREGDEVVGLIGEEELRLALANVRFASQAA